MVIESLELDTRSDDGHCATVLARIPPQPSRSLLWLPALGVAARHYLPFAEALAAHGVAVFLHEWRGHGSSTLRAGRASDWGYQALLESDLPASEAVVTGAAPGLPRVIGGHSLGGQLACCRLALAPQAAQALWLVASGSPYWRSFPARHRWLLPLAYRFLPWLAQVRGSLPGRSVGFGGNEARGLIRDWARSGLSGRYAAAGIDTDLETALRNVRVPVRSVLLQDDWLAPEASLRYLLGKLSLSADVRTQLDAVELGVQADHFGWMKQPQRVAAGLAAAKLATAVDGG
jgi:predicted alpha/beta hydrolase